MATEDPLDEELDLPSDGEAEDWDEETLGLDWNESDAQEIANEITSSWR
jgi:hypothetical protein